MMGLDIRPARWRQQAAYWWSAFVLPQTNELPTEQSVRSGRLRTSRMCVFWRSLTACKFHGPWTGKAREIAVPGRRSTDLRRPPAQQQ